MRLVLDTDVVVSAMRSPSGASAALLMAARRGEITILANVPLAIEYEAVCLRPQHRQAVGLSLREAQQLVDAVIALAEPVETYFVWRPQLADASDEMVLEAAVNGQAGAIVTFNRNDFGRAPKRFGIDVLPPAEALRRPRQ